MKLVGKFLIGLVLVPTIGYGQNYFKEGTVWYENFYSNAEPSLRPWAVYSQWLEQVTGTRADEEDFTVYTLYKQRIDIEDAAIPVCSIKTVGEKVYFQASDAGDVTWYLMYDFGIQPGEENRFYNFTFTDEKEEFFNAELKCMELMASNPKYDNWETISLQSLSPTEGMASDEHVWLKGLGSVRGLFGDFFLDVYPLDGTGGSKLVAVTYEGETIYGETVDVETVECCSPLSVNTDGVNVVVNNATPGETITLYSLDGAVISRIQATDSPAVLPAPCNGPIIVKVGNATRKLMIAKE